MIYIIYTFDFKIFALLLLPINILIIIYTVPKAVWKIFQRQNFPSQHGILPVLFQKISIQQYPRKKYLWLIGKFPSHDFHLIVGKFTQDNWDTAPPPHCSAPSREISELYKIYSQLGKNGPCCTWSDSVVANMIFVLSLDFLEISEGKRVK